MGNKSSPDNKLKEPLELNSLNKLSKAIDAELIRIEIGKTISTIIKDIGIKHYPDAYVQKRIIYYLLAYYNEFSLVDIRLAFELALTGALKVDSQHYQSFDIRYISRILNAYRDYKKAKSLHQIPLKCPPTASRLPSRASKNAFKSYIVRLDRALKQSKSAEQMPIIHALAYNKLVEHGILQISESYWTDLMAKAELQYLTRLRQSRNYEHKRILEDFEKVKYQYPFELTRIQRIAKKIAVINFFKQLKASGKSLNTFINLQKPQNHD